MGCKKKRQVSGEKSVIDEIWVRKGANSFFISTYSTYYYTFDDQVLIATSEKDIQ